MWITVELFTIFFVVHAFLSTFAAEWTSAEEICPFAENICIGISFQLILRHKPKEMIDILSKFEPITLEQMNSVKLMNRTDTKFVTNLDKLHQLLEMAQADYFVQDIDGGRNLEYDTTYFDTTDFDMYCQHQYGHTNRQKIRFRTYCVSGLQFMEVKTKNNHGRTKKKRIEVGDMNLADEEKRQFLAKHLRYDVDSLVPALNNHFSRITLVNKAKTERLTIDSRLRFHNMQDGC